MGRLAQSVTTREPEWDEHQQALVLALAVYRAGLCQRCHGELEETTSPLHDRDNPHGTHMYKRARLVRCHQCTASMESERVHADDKNVKHPGAVVHYVELVERKRRR